MIGTISVNHPIHEELEWLADAVDEYRQWVAKTNPHERSLERVDWWEYITNRAETLADLLTEGTQ